MTGIGTPRQDRDFYYRVITPRVDTMTDGSVSYRVEELGAAAGIGVDTVRYYQGLGLLPPADRQGRSVVYQQAHLTRLRTIRALADDGFTLAQIKRLIEESGHPLLESLAGNVVGLTRQELAERSGLAPPLIDIAVSAGLIEPLGNGDEERFSPEVAPMLTAGFSLLEAGFPLDKLAALATRHATGVESIVDEAIDLFKEHVRSAQSDSAEDLAKLFRTLVSHVTRLVAQHFHHTVVSRVKERLEGSTDQALVSALESTGKQQLVISTEWN